MLATNSRYRRSFTLIELLVVVSVMALLIALLLPALEGARRQGRVTVCASQLRQWGVATRFYSDDYAGSLPISHFNGRWLPHLWNYTVTQIGGSGTFWHGHGLLYGDQYVRDPMLAMCPSMKEEDSGGFIHGAYRHISKDELIDMISKAIDDLGSIPAARLHTMYIQRSTFDYATQPDSNNKQNSWEEQLRYGEMNIDQYNHVAIMCDNLRAWPDSVQQSHPDGANVVFNDGHTNFYPGDPYTFVGFRRSAPSMLFGIPVTGMSPTITFNVNDPANLLFYADEHP